MTRANDNTLPIADRCIAAKHFGVPHFTSAEERREREFVLSSCRGAKRYYLDDDVTEAASALGQEHPEILLEALRRARTPFERILLDYSPGAFVHAGGGLPAGDAPERSMCLIEHLHDTQYRLTPIFSLRRDWAGAQCVSVLYDLEKRIASNDDEVLLAKIWQSTAAKRGVRVVSPNGAQDFAHLSFSDEHALKMVRSTLYGGGRDISRDKAFGAVVPTLVTGETTAVLRGVSDQYHDNVEGHVIAGEPLDPQEDEAEETRRLQIEEFKTHARHELTPCNQWAYRRLLREEKDHSYIHDVVAEAINEFSGQFRFAICALYLINGQDFTNYGMWRAGVGQRIVGGKVAPYLEHRRVSLKIPRLEIRRRAIQHLGESIPRRRHEVSGHWRHRHGKGDAACTHVWANVTPNRQECQLCGYDRWWVPDFERGDASLGYVLKDRVVEER